MMRILFVFVIYICTAVAERCGFPGNPRNGTISIRQENYTVGTTVLYSCANRYVLSDNTSRTCREDGTWSGSIPFCFLRYTLDDLSLVKNLSETVVYETPEHKRGATVQRIFLQFVEENMKDPTLNVYPNGSKKKYTCSKGTLENTYRCLELRHERNQTVVQIYTTSELTALNVDIKNGDGCGEPERLTNSKVNRSKRVAQYTCEAGYTVSGNPTRRCQKNGTWNGKPPSCLPSDNEFHITANTEGFGKVGEPRLNEDEQMLPLSVWEPPANLPDKKLESFIRESTITISKIVKENVINMDKEERNREFSTTENTEKLMKVGEALKNISGQSLPSSVVEPLANLTERMLNVPESIIREIAINIPQTLEVIMSNVDLEGKPEIRTKTENVEINIWNTSALHDVHVVCGAPNFSSPSIRHDRMSECPNNSTEYAVSFPERITEGIVVLSVFKGNTLFPVGNYSYEYVVQAKVSSNPQATKKNSPVIEIQFRKPRPSGDVSCNFLDTSDSAEPFGTWSSEGCWVKYEDDINVHCQCSHFTHFAALFHAPVAVSFSKTLQITTTIGLCLSIISLFLTFITYLILPNLRSRTNHILFHLCTAMLLMNILFVANIKSLESKVKCYFTAFTLHVSTLATFTWLLVLTTIVALSGWKGTQAIPIIEKYIKRTSVICWLIPILIATLTAAVDHSVYTTNPQVCWLNETGFIYAFLPFYTFLTVVQCLLWVGIWVKVGTLMKVKTSKPEVAMKFASQIFLSFILFILTNMMWIVGIGAYILQNGILSLVFAIIAPTQGIFIFIFYVYMDSKGYSVWSAIIRMLRPGCCGTKEKAGSSMQATKSSYVSDGKITKG